MSFAVIRIILEKIRTMMRRREEGERAEGRRKVRELRDSLASVVITDGISQWRQNHSGEVGNKSTFSTGRRE